MAINQKPRLVQNFRRKKIPFIKFEIAATLVLNAGYM